MLEEKNKAIRLTDTEKSDIFCLHKSNIAMRSASIAAELSPKTHSFQKQKTFHFLPSDNVYRSMHVVMRRQNLCK